MNINDLSDSPLPLFALWFILIYLLGYFVVFKNWDKKYRSEASSCFMSLAHGTPALVLAVLSILQSQKSTVQIDLARPNTAFQNTVLEYSIAYFLMDLLHYMVLVPSDVLFIAHHFATLYVLMTCRYMFGYGAAAILGILVLAEVTTTCQNTWSLSRYRKVDSAKATSVFEFLSPIFYAYYTLIRGIIAPLFVYKIGLLFIGGVVDSVIPRWAWISWFSVTVVGIGVSMLWVLHLWVDLYRQRSDKMKLS